jgi:hypothetical protein
MVLGGPGREWWTPKDLVLIAKPPGNLRIIIAKSPHMAVGALENSGSSKASGTWANHDIMMIVQITLTTPEILTIANVAHISFRHERRIPATLEVSVATAATFDTMRAARAFTLMLFNLQA